MNRNWIYSPGMGIVNLDHIDHISEVKEKEGTYRIFFRFAHVEGYKYVEFEDEEEAVHTYNKLMDHIQSKRIG